MTRVQRDAVAILMALAEEDDGIPVPKAILVIAMGGDTPRYYAAEFFLVETHMVHSGANELILTDKGRAAGEKFNKALAV